MSYLFLGAAPILGRAGLGVTLCRGEARAAGAL